MADLIRELLALQEEEGWLSGPSLEALARRLNLPAYEVEGVVSFYPHFRRSPRRGPTIRACRDVSCRLADGGAGLAALRAACAGRSDVHFEPASCLGRCDGAPACSVDEVPMGVDQALAWLRSGRPERGALPAPMPPPATRAWRLDPHESEGARYGELRAWTDRLVVEGRGAVQEAMLDRLDQSELRGMGGAGFPTGRKWRLVREQPVTPRYVVCNADESEPGTFKDRVGLAELPHLLIEGLALAGLAIGSSRGIVFIRHEYGPERAAFESALVDARERGALGRGIFGSDLDFEIEVFVSPGGYILGEETALLEALEGRRGEPRHRPPFPGQSGLHARPTLINNVETLAQIPRALRTGRADLKLFAVSGDVARPGVVEALLGTPLRALIDACGGMRGGRALQAFLPGGASTGFLPATEMDVPMSWEALRERERGLGAAAVVVVGEGRQLTDLARNLVEFFRNESCGKCVPCRLGTEKAAVLVAEGAASHEGALRALHDTLRETSICGLGQVALVPIISVLDLERPQAGGAPSGGDG